MEPNDTQDGITPQEDTIEETTEEVAEPQEQKPVQETDQARLARLERMYSQQRKKMGIHDEPVKQSPKSEGLDYGAKAYLVANGIKGADEISLVQEAIKRTGDTLDDVIADEYFQAKLQKMRKAKEVQEAMPNGSKRSTTSARTSVEYWIAKGELPPASEVDLRRQVVNAKIKQRSVENVFTSNPVVQ